MSDLDGTLLDSQKRVSPRNIAAIERFKRGGGYFTFATGRSMPATVHLIEGFALNAPAVLANGCHGYDFASGQTVYEWGVGESAVQLALETARQFPECGVEIHTAHKVYVARDSVYTRHHFEMTKMPFVFAEPCSVPLPWVKLCMTLTPEKMPALMDFIVRESAGEFFLQLSAPHFLEVQAKNTDKGAGALEICRRMNIHPENLITVGDGSNDIELLRASKRAFAPANACAEIIALAPRMLPGCDEHCIEALIDLIDKERN